MTYKKTKINLNKKYLDSPNYLVSMVVQEKTTWNELIKNKNIGRQILRNAVIIYHNVKGIPLNLKNRN